MTFLIKGIELFFLYVLYCFEVGIFLLLFPWVAMWEQNSILTLYPALRSVILNDFFRGAVSGLGVSNLLLGVWEIAHFSRYFRET